MQEFDKNSITKVALSGSTASRRRRRPTCLPRQVPVTARIYRPLTRGVAVPGRPCQAGRARQAVPGRRVRRARSSVRKGFPVRLSSRLSVHCSPGHGAWWQLLDALWLLADSLHAWSPSSIVATLRFVRQLVLDLLTSHAREYFQVPSKSRPKWRFRGNGV